MIFLGFEKLLQSKMPSTPEMTLQIITHSQILVILRFATILVASSPLDIYPLGVYYEAMALEDAHCETCSDEHPDHSKQLHRINRLIGQLEGVKRMISERRYCPDILTQTRAISSAVRSLEANILQVHLENCVADALSSEKGYADQKVAELVDIFRKYK